MICWKLFKTIPRKKHGKKEVDEKETRQNVIEEKGQKEEMRLVLVNIISNKLNIALQLTEGNTAIELDR